MRARPSSSSTTVGTPVRATRLALSALQDKPAWKEAARYFRLAVRKIARSTDERTAIAAFTSPGYLFNITANVERTPQVRSNADALLLCAVINSFVFDWTLRQKTAATVNLFILEACPVCETPSGRIALSGARRAAPVVQSCCLCAVMAGATRTLPGGKPHKAAPGRPSRHWRRAGRCARRWMPLWRRPTD